MAFKVIFVIRLPRFTAHVAEAFPTNTRHKITTRRPLYSLATPGTQLCVLGYPLSIGFLLEHNIQPSSPFLASAGRVVVVHAPETENLAAGALDRSDGEVLALDAVVAISTRAASVELAGAGEELADLFLVPMENT